MGVPSIRYELGSPATMASQRRMLNRLRFNVNNAQSDLVNNAFAGCKAYLSSPMSIPSGITTAIPFDAESYDTSSMHDVSANQERITVPSDGAWLISAQVNYQLASIGFVDLIVRVNGTLKYKIGHSLTSANPDNGIAMSIVHKCAAGDYFELLTAHYIIGSQPINVGENNTWMSVNYLGSV